MSDPIDTPLEFLGGAIFVTLCGLGILSWFYGVWEWIGLFRLKPAAFERGRVVLSFVRDLPHPELAHCPPEKVTTKTGQFRFISATECLFSPRFSWFSSRLQTPFPIKGRIRFFGSHAEIEGRAPIGTSLFCTAWALAWPIIPSLSFVSGEASLAHTLSSIGGGLVAVFALVAFSFFIELRRANTIVSEIEAYLRRRAA